ncbi:MAG TPA: cytochrome c biogenesis protein CcsA [Gammaproteobacteria bacterium]
MKALLPILSILLYSAAAYLLLRRLAAGIESGRHSKILALSLGLFAALLHLFVLRNQILVPQGLNLGFFHVLSLTSWLGAVIVLFSALKRPVENLAIVVLPFTAVALLLQSTVSGGEMQVVVPASGLRAHILLSIFSYSLLAIAALQALLLAVQNRHLRNRHPGGFVRALPPLETMEQLLFQMIGVGYILLSLSLLSGATYIEDIFAQHLVHKTVLSLAAWLVFAVLLWGRWRYGWRGRVAIRWTLIGFVALMMAYFGSKLVLELILHR